MRKYFFKNLWLPRWLAFSLGSMSEFFTWLIQPAFPWWFPGDPGSGRKAISAYKSKGKF